MMNSYYQIYHRNRGKFSITLGKAVFGHFFPPLSKPVKGVKSKI